MSGITIKARTEDVVTYVPDFQDNREQAAAGEPHFSVQISPMSGADYDRLHSSTFGGKKLSQSALMRKAKIFARRLIEERVHSVSGFALDAGGIIEEPRTGADLYDAIMRGDVTASEIIDDICEAIKDASSLSEGELGNLQRGSASSAQRIPQSESGRAADAPSTSIKKAIPTSTEPSNSEKSPESETPGTATGKPIRDSALHGTLS